HQPGLVADGEEGAPDGVAVLGRGERLRRDHGRWKVADGRWRVEDSRAQAAILRLLSPIFDENPPALDAHAASGEELERLGEEPVLYLEDAGGERARGVVRADRDARL